MCCVRMSIAEIFQFSLSRHITDHEGMPYCETHYHAKRGSLCAGCSKPITGRCITAMFRKFHPEHFVCAFCLKQLNKGEEKKMSSSHTVEGEREERCVNF